MHCKVKVQSEATTSRKTEKEPPLLCHRIIWEEGQLSLLCVHLAVLLPIGLPHSCVHSELCACDAKGHVDHCLHWVGAGPIDTDLTDVCVSAVLVVGNDSHLKKVA